MVFKSRWNNGRLTESASVQIHINGICFCLNTYHGKQMETALDMWKHGGGKI